LHFWWQVQQSLMRYGDQSIVFSDLVYKFNRSNKMQQRVLIITDQALYVRELPAVSFCNNSNMYVMNDVKLSICRRITLQELGCGGVGSEPEGLAAGWECQGGLEGRQGQIGGHRSAAQKGQGHQQGPGTPGPAGW
jgi:hypothetical protein